MLSVAIPFLEPFTCTVAPDKASPVALVTFPVTAVTWATACWEKIIKKINGISLITRRMVSTRVKIGIILCGFDFKLNVYKLSSNRMVI